MLAFGWVSCRVIMFRVWFQVDWKAPALQRVTRRPNTVHIPTFRIPAKKKLRMTEIFFRSPRGDSSPRVGRGQIQVSRTVAATSPAWSGTRERFEPALSAFSEVGHPVPGPAHPVQSSRIDRNRNH